MFVHHSQGVKKSALRLYRSGMTIHEIADTVGISCTTIVRWRRAAGVTRPRRGARLYSDAMRDRVMEAYRSGRTATEIRSVYGVSENTIRWWARTMGVRRDAPLDRRRHSRQVRERAVELYAAGRNSKEVAEILGDGIDGHTVVAWVRAAGVTPRPSNSAPKVDHREAERLYAKLGTYARVAEVLECSVSGVVRALQRALTERVRKELRDAGG